MTDVAPEGHVVSEGVAELQRQIELLPGSRQVGDLLEVDAVCPGPLAAVLQ